DKFRIYEIDAVLFSVSGNKSDNGCYHFSDTVIVSELGKRTLLMGIRFKLEYVSTRKFHFWENNNSLDGAYGHVDTIKAISVLSGDSPGMRLSNDTLEDASGYKFFTAENISASEGHHGNQNGCYEAQALGNLKKFTAFYNDNGTKDNMVIWMRDFHIFKIPGNCDSLFVLKSPKINIRFSDGKIISSNLKYIKI
ncbi:MAG: hypothetical protein Q8932_17230, partial [Bacteroidota bacterium]|nr:hypothetical protein [Bacteroidota bacterium]